MEIIFYNRLDAINFLENSKEFLSYLDNTNIVTLPEKIGSSNKNISSYLDKVKTFNQKEINQVVNIVNSLPKLALTSDAWIFIKVSDNLEKAWPFTIENTIVITSKLLKESTLDDLTYTFCHEKIHNLQWKYPNMFYEMYKNFGFDVISISNLDTLIVYSNPDALQTKQESWIIKYKNQYLLPIMLYDNGSIEKKSVKIKIKNRIGKIMLNTKSYDSSDIFSTIFPECNSSQCYHPHEVFADLGATYIINGSLDSPILSNFFLKLDRFIFDYVL